VARLSTQFTDRIPHPQEVPVVLIAVIGWVDIRACAKGILFLIFKKAKIY